MTATPNMLIKRIDENLVLRTACPEDADALAEFNSMIHSDSDAPDLPVGAWTRDLLTRPHPIFRPQDFTIVEDTRSSKIVSSCNLIPQTWVYGGIPFAVGRPELVGTAPDYRNRGLVRAQFEVMHAWCEERGLNVQAITGIPFYYRQFGYEMTLRLDGWKSAWEGLIPALKEGENEPYHFRPACADDLAWLADLYARSCRRYLLSAQWTEEIFRYELMGKSPENVTRNHLVVIETLTGQRAGFFSHPGFTNGTALISTWFELEEKFSWRKVTPPVLRYLLAIGKTIAAAKQKECTHAGFMLGENHPVYQAAHEWLQTIRRPYAYYLRVADLPAFLRHIAPVLEKRLSGSAVSGYDGKLKISFFRSGVEMTFEEGRLVSAAAYKPQRRDDTGAAFPDQTFLHLLFGHRSLDEVQYIYPDCRANDEARLLLNVLFPPAPSDIWPIS